MPRNDTCRKKYSNPHTCIAVKEVQASIIQQLFNLPGDKIKKLSDAWTGN